MARRSGKVRRRLETEGKLEGKENSEGKKEVGG